MEEITHGSSLGLMDVMPHKRKNTLSSRQVPASGTLRDPAGLDEGSNHAPDTVGEGTWGELIGTPPKPPTTPLGVAAKQRCRTAAHREVRGGYVVS